MPATACLACLVVVSACAARAPSAPPPTETPASAPAEVAVTVAATAASTPFETATPEAFGTAAPTPVSAWVPAPRTKTFGCVSRGGLPDSACTPGAVDSRVNQTDIGATICTSGYSRSVRPPARITDQIKREQMLAYGLVGHSAENFELDHLIPLELGGAPADVANLWPEPRTGEATATMKDAVETYLHDQVCNSRAPLAEAQREIATDWLAVYTSRHLAGGQ